MGKPIGQRNGGAGGRDRGVGNHQPAANPNHSRLRLPSGLQGPVTEGGKYGMDKIVRQEEARARQELRDNRLAEGQLQMLDDRLGVGIGATKERKRLKKLIQNRDKASAQATPIEHAPGAASTLSSKAQVVVKNHRKVKVKV